MQSLLDHAKKSGKSCPLSEANKDAKKAGGSKEAKKEQKKAKAVAKGVDPAQHDKKEAEKKAAKEKKKEEKDASKGKLSATHRGTNLDMKSAMDQLKQMHKCKVNGKKGGPGGLDNKGAEGPEASGIQKSLADVVKSMQEATKVFKT